MVAAVLLRLGVDEFVALEVAVLRFRPFPRRCQVPSLAISLLLPLLCAPACAQNLVVVVSAKSEAAKLTTDQVASIFLGSVKSFPGGDKAVPVDQSPGTPSYIDFYSRAAGRSEAQMKAYWSRMVFTGKGSPPQDAGDGAAVKKLVAANPNLVGYIDAALVDGSVKVLSEIK